MPNAQGINVKTKRVKQAALGTPGGAGSKLMRRVSLVLNKTSESYESQEIVDHQMSTGSTQGPSSVAGQLQGELSAGTYDLEFAALVRKDFVATADLTGLSITIAGAGPTYTVTRAAGSFLTGGIKFGDIVRLTAGAFNAANAGKNLFVLSVTATVLTVIPLNGVALVAEGPVATATLSVPGKKAWTPTTGHTNDYFSWEKWFSDISRSELFTDVKPAQAEVTLPATGIPTVNFTMAGLGRTPTGVEALTAPSAASTSNTLAGVCGRILLDNGAITITGLQLTINGNTQPGTAEVGSDTLTDLQRGKIQVSGSFSAKFSGAAIQAIRDNQNIVPLAFVMGDSKLANAEFVSFVMPAIKINSDDLPDGDEELIRTYNFTAQYHGAGGANLSSHATIISIQDSLAA